MSAQSNRPITQGDDIYGKWYAEIAKRNWAKMHIAADRREPFALAFTPTKAAP